MRNRFTHIKERKGIFNLMCLIALIVLITSSFKSERNEEYFDFTQIKQVTDQIYKEEYSKAQINVIKAKPAKRMTTPSFNPVKYAGEIIRKEPESKDNPTEKYQKIEVISGKPKHKSSQKPKPEWIKNKYKLQHIDINQSDIVDWEALPGIGPYYAKIITNFREKLGGFTSIDQVGETWRLPDSIFQKIKPLLKPSQIYRKININQATTEEIKNHPYLNWKDAQIITNYRFHRGSFNSVEALYGIKVFDSTFIHKILPYVSIE